MTESSISGPSSSGVLEGSLLIAMPTMGDTRFSQTVIYMCAHSDQGSMGLVINKPAESLSFAELLEQLKIPMGPGTEPITVHYGGPVEMGRGFVLHTSDFHVEDSTMRVDERVSLTATVEILRAVAVGEGPQQFLLALGYAGWGAGQLEGEIKQNGWLHCEPDNELIFDLDDAAKWTRALGKIGVDPSLLSGTAGRA